MAEQVWEENIIKGQVRRAVTYSNNEKYMDVNGIVKEMSEKWR